MGIHTYLCFSLLADDKKTSPPATGWGILVFFGGGREGHQEQTRDGLTGNCDLQIIGRWVIDKGS